MNPLRRYDNEDVLVTLPGEMTIFDIKWLAVWNVDEKQGYGWAIIPDGLNIPPSLVEIIVSNSWEGIGVLSLGAKVCFIGEAL